jgi:FixJ family two-component response regulator
LPDTSPIIHVVDDDPAVCRALKRLLRSWGMQVRTFKSGEEFLAAQAGGQRADCSVVDVHMPGLNGLEVQERLKRAGLDLPVIFITAHDEADIAVRGLRGGAAGFLQKPFSDEALVELIRSALARRVRPDGV